MKRLARLIALVGVAMLPLTMSQAASAATTCPTGYTGPNSTNVCVSVTQYTCQVTSNNNVTINNDNTQVAVSGSGTTGENTNGSGTLTGSATNSNGTTFNVSVDNTGEESICSVVATVPATVTPAAPTKSTVKATVPAPAKAAPTVLPNTSGENTVSMIAATVAALGIGALSVRLVTLAYGRIKG